MTRDEEIEMQNKIADICKRMEIINGFKLDSMTAEGVRTTCFISIAISLKRIADKLELSQKQPVLMTAEEHKRHTADQFIKNRM